MSISSQINRIKDAKTALIAVIRSKGVNVPDGISIEELETYAAQIQQGGTNADRAAFVGIFPEDDDTYIVHPSLYVYDESGTIGVMIDSFNGDVTLVPVNEASEPIEGEALIDSDTVGAIDFEIEQSDVAEAISLDSSQIVKGNTILGIDGTAESATYEESTLEADIDAWGETYASKLASGVQSYDAEGNIIQGAAMVFSDGTSSFQQHTVDNVTSNPNSEQIYAHSNFNGCYNGNFDAPALLDFGAELYTTIDHADVASAIGLQANQIAKGSTVLGVNGTGGITPETPSITVSTGGLITASANGLSKTQQLTTQAAKTVTPSTSSQTAVASGRYTTGAVTVAAIPSQYIIPSGSQTLTENKDYDVTSLSSVTVNVPASGGSSAPSATLTNIYEPSANVRDLGDGTIIFESDDPNPQASISAYGAAGYLDKPFTVDTNTKNFVMAYSTDAKVASAIGLTADKIVSGNTVLGIAGTGGGGGGSTKNVQAYCGAASVTTTSYTATAVKLTVEKTGTYKVSWCGGRNTNSGTSGSQLYINNSAYGSAQTSFSNTYFQSVTLNNVSLTAGQTIVVRARARSTSYVMWVGNLIIEQTA